MLRYARAVLGGPRPPPRRPRGAPRDRLPTRSDGRNRAYDRNTYLAAHAKPGPGKDPVVPRSPKHPRYSWLERESPRSPVWRSALLKEPVRGVGRTGSERPGRFVRHCGQRTGRQSRASSAECPPSRWRSYPSSGGRPAPGELTANTERRRSTKRATPFPDPDHAGGTGPRDLAWVTRGIRSAFLGLG